MTTKSIQVPASSSGSHSLTEIGAGPFQMTHANYASSQRHRADHLVLTVDSGGSSAKAAHVDVK